MSDHHSSLPWDVSRLEPRLGDEEIQSLCVSASAFDIDRQELEKAQREKSVCLLYSLLKRKLGNDSRALSVIVWMLERIDYNDIAELRRHAECECADHDQMAKEFRQVDFLLTVITVFRLIPEEEYGKIRNLVAENYLDGLSPDRVPNRANLVQRMYDKSLIHDGEVNLLYKLLEHHQLNHLCGLLKDYCTCPQQNNQGNWL